MSVPFVNCKIRYYENEAVLACNAQNLKKYGAARKFYSGNKHFDYLTYVNLGSKNKIDYVEYSGDNEKSTGAFGTNGLLTAKERQTLRKKLRATKSIIWDCLLTFQPEFGQTYCNEYEQAYDLMRKEFPRFLKDAGFRADNITWYAGLHTNKRHRHIHISFFENEPTRYREHTEGLQFSLGQIPLTSINRFKLRTEIALTDVAAELKIARKEVTTLCKTVLFSNESMIRYNNEFRSQIIKLIYNLPAEGRLSYDSENMKSLRPIIRQIVDFAMKANKQWYQSFTTFFGEVQKRDAEVRKMLIRNHIDEAKWGCYLNSDVYLEDMYRRLGNQVINYARVYKKRESKSQGRLAMKRIRQKTIDSVLIKAAEMQADMEADSLYFFAEYLKKLEESQEANEMEDVNEME